MNMNLARICFGTFVFFLLMWPCRVDAQAVKETELQEKIQKLEKDLADLRSQQERERGKAAPDSLTLLEQDYRALLKTDRHAAFVEQAAQHLQETNRNTHWMSYMTAIQVLRNHRSQAAVPLLLKYLIVHPAKDPNLGNINSYLDTLVILTGEDVKALYAKGNGGEALVKNWWIPRKNKITVDLERMSAEQLERVVGALFVAMAKADRIDPLNRGSEFSTYNMSIQLSGRDSLGGPGWYENEICSAMLPILLKRCGIVGPGKMTPNNQAVNFQAIPMLAVLRKNGEAPDLDKIAKDEKQSGAARLTCLLANLAAGDDLPTQMLLDLYSKEKRLDLRVIALLELPSSTSPRQATGQLLEALDDPNIHIRTAAVYAMGSITVPAALPKLAKMLNESALVDARGDTSSLTRAITRLGSAEAKQVLADRLEACLNKNDKRNGVYDTLREFQNITGQRWIEAGAHDDAYYRAKAAQALQWWKEQTKKQQ